MVQSLTIIGLLAGGLGLFLLAVGMITNGLKSAAGQNLHDVLSQCTRSPIRGVLTGLSITALVQSSSAVTVATIGFVNAGLISMRRALGIVYGSNIGTTMTGWLVAIIGFKIDVDVFALPIIGVGMFLHLTGGETRRASIGSALAGFGLFFIGVDVLKDAFESIVIDIDITQLTLDGVGGLLLYVMIGFLMTVFTQSSSAAIAVTLTAASGGVLGLYAAAAMVIGANLGTTSTAVLAVIGATSNAKRVALAHIMFNFGTGIVALLLLPVLFWVVETTSEFLGMEAIPAVTLALFHTAFNILGVVLVFPLNNRLADFLEQRFVTQDEVEGLPRYLDKTVAVSPPLAISALVLELSRLTTFVRRLCLAALSQEFNHNRQLARDHLVVIKLSEAITDFLTRVTRGALTQENSNQLTKVLAVQQHLLACADMAVQIASAQPQLGVMSDERLAGNMAIYRAQVVELLTLATPESAEFSFNDCQTHLDDLQVTYDRLKQELLAAGTGRRLPVHIVIDFIDQNSRVRRVPRKMVKAMGLLSELSMMTVVKVSDDTLTAHKSDAAVDSVSKQ